MRKGVVLIIFSVLLSLIFAAGGITVTEKIKLVILPGKIGTGWNMDEVDYLLSVLEEQALELGRFQLFPRSDLQQIMKERNMVEFGVSEAIQIGKLGGSKYALLLTLTELSAAWSSKTSTYEAVSRYTIKLYNIENGELLSSKTMQSLGSSKETSQKAISNALRSTSSDIWIELRNIFKLEAYVKSVQGDTVILAGVDPKLAKTGFIFQIETERGIGYVRVSGINKVEQTVVTKFLYGERPNQYDVAIEYPTLPIHAGLGLSVFSSMFGIGLTAWSDAISDVPLPIYLGFGTFLFSTYSDTPAYLNFGVNLKILEMGRISASINGGVSILGLFDPNNFEPSLIIYGAFAGGLVTYEFNPKFGIYCSTGYSLYISGSGPSGISFQIGVYF
ncbi:MAG: hypothetical protein ABDH59_06475 [Fervidobacterium sp.]